MTLVNVSKHSVSLRPIILYHQMLSAVLGSHFTVSSTRAAKPSVPNGGW